MRIFGRYLVFQGAGWGLSAAGLGILVYLDWMPFWLAATLVGVMVVKDLVLYPMMRKAYVPGHTHGYGALLGSEVRVSQALAPEGYVMAGAERWRARLGHRGAGALAAGERAVVRHVENMTLIVEPLDP